MVLFIALVDPDASSTSGPDSRGAGPETQLYLAIEAAGQILHRSAVQVVGEDLAVTMTLIVYGQSWYLLKHESSSSKIVLKITMWHA